MGVGSETVNELMRIAPARKKPAAAFSNYLVDLNSLCSSLSSAFCFQSYLYSNYKGSRRTTRVFHIGFICCDSVKTIETHFDYANRERIKMMRCYLSSLQVNFFFSP